ncbi:MAG: prolyl oligopeptidase family serine peptidase [Candidatus Moduliflexus flocculans]|nr:prolyl oligopeptidase family serine peptidase [Candidatus Moduliflexus flocculans]
MAFSRASPDGARRGLRLGPAAATPRTLTRMTDQVAGLRPGHARGHLLEEQGRDDDRGRPHQAGRLRPGQEATPCSASSTAGRRASTGRCSLVRRRATTRPTSGPRRGALVLKVNYRGSAGYGEKFRQLNVRNLGVGDAWDVLSGVDYLVKKGWVDPARVGCMGWSQGGYISAFLTTSITRVQGHLGRARASRTGPPTTTTPTSRPFTINYLGDDPADDPEIYAKTSPMTYIKQAKTPTLIQHGELDRRVPIPNAYELRQGLEDRGVPVEMVVYKGFGHGITKPKAHAGGDGAQPGLVQPLHLRRPEAGPGRAAAAQEERRGTK